MESQEILYKEKQYSSRPIIQWIVGLVVGFLCIKSLIAGSFFDLSSIGLFIFSFIRNAVLLGIVSLTFLRLNILVKNDGLYYCFPPIKRSFSLILFADIQKYEIRQYDAVKEYMGWGIRCGTNDNDRAYTMSGNKGIQFMLKNGERILVGTQKPEKLLKLLDTLMVNSANDREASEIKKTD